MKELQKKYQMLKKVIQAKFIKEIIHNGAMKKTA